jgi:ABC-type uncharacterized transport system auxiliary subunit
MKNVTLIAVLVVPMMWACGGSVPSTRYYQLAAPTKTTPRAGSATIAIEPLQADAAYDDERIVYRLNPYRLDYYNYHRWSAPPGTLVSNYLQEALARSGKFRAVVHEGGEAAPVVLGGRLVAIEEVDSSKVHWLGRISVELTLTDSTSGQVLWSEMFEETAALPAQTPEGLARAISAALQRIVDKASPIVADLAEKQGAVHEARAAAKEERRLMRLH